MLSRIVSLNTKVKFFQTKLPKIVLYPNKMVFKIGNVPLLLRSFCKAIDNTPELSITNQLWRKLRCSVESSFRFSLLTTQRATLRLNDLTDNLSLLNHIPLIFKSCVYSARDKKLLIIAAKTCHSEDQRCNKPRKLK